MSSAQIQKWNKHNDDTLIVWCDIFGAGETWTLNVFLHESQKYDVHCWSKDMRYDRLLTRAAFM